VLSASSYDGNGELAAVDYANSTHLSAIGKDQTGKVTSLTWKTSDNHDIVSAVTRTRAGTIVDESLGGADPNPTGANYAYDAAGRLTEAYVTGHHYTYDFTSAAAGTCPTGTQTNAGVNTNRMRLLDQTSGGTATTNYCYDATDRLLSVQGDTAVTGVSYDAHGNTTGYTSGNITTLLNFDTADRNILASTNSGSDPSQNAAISYSRDATGRIARRDATSGDTAGSVLYGYTASGDSADITYDVNKRYTSFTVPLPGGVLLTNQNPAATWNYPSVRGDLVLTATNTGTQQDDLRTYDPYGQPLTVAGAVDPQNVPDNSPGKIDYGWLGQHQRPTNMPALLPWSRWAPASIAPSSDASSRLIPSKAVPPTTTITLLPAPPQNRLRRSVVVLAEQSGQRYSQQLAPYCFDCGCCRRFSGRDRVWRVHSLWSRGWCSGCVCRLRRCECRHTELVFACGYSNDHCWRSLGWNRTRAKSYRVEPREDLRAYPAAKR
jgi:hypothetical protein